MSACFIGHRKIKKTEQLISSLKMVVENLINKGVTTFLFGSVSDFDKLSYDIVTNFKAKHPEITRVYVRSSYQHIDKSYENYLLNSYEKTYFPKQIENAGKYSYIERNCEMIDNAKYCVFYYDENYTTEQIGAFKRKSGTKFAFEYAVKKKKEIINLYN